MSKRKNKKKAYLGNIKPRTPNVTVSNKAEDNVGALTFTESCQLCDIQDRPLINLGPELTGINEMVQLIHGLFPGLEVCLRQTGQRLVVGDESGDGRYIVVLEDWDWKQVGIGLGLILLVEVEGGGGGGCGGKHFFFGVRNKNPMLRFGGVAKGGGGWFLKEGWEMKEERLKEIKETER